jgi:hypothetical protein
MKAKLPFGIRINNPGNLEQTNPRTPWQGRVADYALTQHRFEEFENPVKGLRALNRDLITKYDRGLDTVKKIITVYAPATENNTKAYIKRVTDRLDADDDTCALEVDDEATKKKVSDICFRANITENTRLNLHDYETLNNLVRAIVRHENGKGPLPGGEWYEDKTYTEAYRQAGITRTQKQVVTQSKTIRASGLAGVGGSVLGATAVLDAAQEAKSVLDPGSYIYAAITIIVLICCAYVVYDRVRKAKIESQ